MTVDGSISRGYYVSFLSKLGAMFVATMMMSACSVIPGLNVSETGGLPAGDKSVVEQGGATEYRVQSGGQQVSYRLIEVSGASLPSIRAATDAIVPPLPTGFGSVTPAMVPSEYVIGPGDVIHVTVWDHPELTIPTGQFSGDLNGAGRLVSSGGMMFYPYVGEFKAAGMTIVELRNFLGNSLARFITKPQVDARVVAFRSQRIQVTGEVAQPGLITLDDTPKGALEAINERGGLSPTASRRRVLLTRNGVSYPIDLSSLLSGERATFNPQLRAGDIVHVPDQSNDLVFVLGEVEQQQQVVLQQGKTTLTEALTRSGGLDKLRADDSGVLVFRRPFADGVPPTIYSLELDNPLGLLLAGEFVLQPRDVVYVKATAFSKYNSVINQLLPTISAVFQLDRLVND